MKIAFCFSGGVRNFETTISYLKKNLLDHYDHDVFIYGVANKYGIADNISKLTDNLSPKNIILNENLFYDTIRNQFNVYGNVLPMYFNILKCDELRQEYETTNNIKYDYVVRLRFDNFFYRTLNDVNIDLNLLNDNSIMIPHKWNFIEVHPLAKTDMFAIGTSKSMTKYASLYKNINTYFFDKNIPKNRDGSPHPETLLGYHLNKINLNIIPIEDTFQHEHPKELNMKFIDINHDATFRKTNYD